MEQWEYKVVELKGETPTENEEEQLRNLGRQGWELVSISEPYAGYFGPGDYFRRTAYLKRKRLTKYVPGR